MIDKLSKEDIKELNIELEKAKEIILTLDDNESLERLMELDFDIE